MNVFASNGIRNIHQKIALPQNSAAGFGLPESVSMFWVEGNKISHHPKEIPLGVLSQKKILHFGLRFSFKADCFSATT